MKWQLGICIILFSACQQVEKPKYTKLTGHWHIFQRDDSLDCYTIIDFEKSTFYEDAFKDIYREDYYFKGAADFPNQKLHFTLSSGRLIGSYKYEFCGESILIKDIEDSSSKVIDSEYYAVGTNKKQCNWYKDAFCCTGLSVELSEVIENEDLVELPVLGLQIAIHVGYLKSKKSDSILVRGIYAPRNISAEDLPLIIEKSYVSNQLLRRSEIQLAFYADKETKIKYLKPILQKLAEIPDRPEVVLVFQYNPQPDAFELFGKEVIFEGVDWMEVEDDLLFSEYVLQQ